MQCWDVTMQQHSHYILSNWALAALIITFWWWDDRPAQVMVQQTSVCSYTAGTLQVNYTPPTGETFFLAQINWAIRKTMFVLCAVTQARKIGCLFYFICITGFIKCLKIDIRICLWWTGKKASYSAGCKNQTSGLLTYKSYWFFLKIMDIVWRRRSTGPSWKKRWCEAGCVYKLNRYLRRM